MICDLDQTIQNLLKKRAQEGSELAGARISFEIPNESWQAKLEGPAINCYLYSIIENRERRTQEPMVQRNDSRAIRRPAPTRIDCSYCITAWSGAEDDRASDEHNLLGQVLKVLFKYQTLPADVLYGELGEQIPPLPTAIAGADGIKNQPEFWGALNQPLKPSITYTVTLALMLEDRPPKMLEVVKTVALKIDSTPAITGINPFSMQPGSRATLSVSGFRTHFSDRSEIQFLPADNISIGNKKIESPTKLSVEISIDNDASQEDRTLQIITDTEIVKRIEGLKVLPVDR